MGAGFKRRWIALWVAVAGIAAAGAFLGQRCRTTARLGVGRSLGFTVSGLASARGHVFPFARATAVDAAAAHAVTRVIVLGPLVACPATVMPGRTPPPAHAAC